MTYWTFFPHTPRQVNCRCLKMVNAMPALWASKQPQVAKQDEAEDKKV